MEVPEPVEEDGSVHDGVGKAQKDEEEEESDSESRKTALG